jgi:hypothetical protein
MVNVSSPKAFETSLGALAAFKKQAGGKNYKGRFVQIFLGLKFFQAEVPSMYSGGFVSSGILESMLDDLYQKSSKPLYGCVLSLFEKNFLPRTGVRAPDKAYAANNWRNNFNLQKGFGCFASVSELSSPTFLDESREHCQHLVPGPDGGIKGGRCALSSSEATYRSEQHRKWLRIDPGGNGYATLDLLNVKNFAPYVAPAGRRIPIVPLMVALYHDGQPGTVLGDRDQTSITLGDFCADFNFSSKEVDAYFELDTKHPLNEVLLKSFADIGYVGPSSSTSPGFSENGIKGKGGAAEPSIPEPKLGGTAAPPPKLHSGWDAEQYVAAALEGAKWEAHDVSRQRLGYDILAKKGKRTVFVEVKSSLGLCSPCFTAREWHQAQTYKDRYILAVVENFDPSGKETNHVHWIKDPATVCSANSAVSTAYTIPRGQWVTSVIALSDI